jgi:hypothetical protein
VTSNSHADGLDNIYLRQHMQSTVYQRGVDIRLQDVSERRQRWE